MLLKKNLRLKMKKKTSPMREDILIKSKMRTRERKTAVKSLLKQHNRWKKQLFTKEKLAKIPITTKLEASKLKKIG